MNLIYLAAPYTAEQYAIREWRVQTCTMFSAACRIQGIQVYSPIVECHQVEKYLKGDQGAVEFWADYNRLMMRKADEFWILPLPGWEESRGVAMERIYWRTLSDKAVVEEQIVHDWQALIRKAFS